MASPGKTPATNAQPWLGEWTFPRLWLLTCNLWIYLVAAGALVMNFVMWLMIIIKNSQIFSDELHHYLGNDAARYGGSAQSGYVDNTNIPKHLGGVVFCAMLAVAMMILVLLALAGDLFIKFPFGIRLLEAFFFKGLYTEEKDFEKVEFFFVAANAFLKLFIVVVGGSESYIGLQTVGAPDIDTPLFCLYAVLILLGSIPFTAWAEMMVIGDTLRPNEKKRYTKKTSAA